MELQVKNRTILGKKVKSLRKEGMIPAELFGRNMKNVHLSVSEKQFAKVYKDAGEHTVVMVHMEDGKKVPVLISKVMKNYLKNQVMAVDLYGVRMDEKIKTKVPIEFKGEAPAVKNGFLVVKVLKEVEIEALPMNLPRHFEISLTGLETTGQSIHVKEIKAPENVRIITGGETVIATVTEKAKEETVMPAPVAETTIPSGEAPETAKSEETKEKSEQK